jgi:aminopeptidase N
VQDTLATAVYRLPLKIDIWEGGSKKTVPIIMDRSRHVMEIPYANQPDLVLFDADAQLLATIEYEKKTSEWIYQYNHATKFLHKYDALIALEGKLADPEVRAVMTKALNDSFWRLRQLAVANFTEYSGPEFATIEKTIRDLARNDASSMVRAEAILVLSSFGDNENDQIFKEALSDTSYHVVSIALDSYLLNKQDDADTVIAEFVDSSNDAVITSVGNYFSKNPKPEHFEWFLEKMTRMNSMDKYNFLQVFGKYLIKCPQDIQRQSLPLLEGLARNSPAYFVRFGAYQVLGLLSDIQGVSAIRKDIRAKENDKRLKDMYSQFGDF